MLRYLTAGESHGPALTAIVEGFPSGLHPRDRLIDRELERRQGGYGRGKRQTIETDRIIVESGVFHGVTTGGPITLRLLEHRRQARASRRAGRAARGAHRPRRRHQLSDRHSPGSGTRQRPRNRLASGRQARWPSCCWRSWGSRCSATCARSGALWLCHNRSIRPCATPARSTRSIPRPTRRSSRRSTRRGPPATRWAASSRRS